MRVINEIAGMRRAAVELLEQWPKGCPAPIGYADWFEWARAQKLHGLKQEQCGICGLWLFPQDKHGPACAGLTEKRRAPSAPEERK